MWEMRKLILYMTKIKYNREKNLPQCKGVTKVDIVRGRGALELYIMNRIKGKTQFTFCVPQRFTWNRFHWVKRIS